MYVNTNVAALNAWRNLENTTQNMTGVLQQLSSGLRINSAANDPAGLAISQQMQSQINGMNQAYQNAQTGTSFLQTADGALSQIQNLLQSMYSLATESANGTNVGVDRGSLQSEMNQYTQEINSITNQTAFNTKNLLDGVLGNVNLAVGANPNQELQFSLAAVDAQSLGVAGTAPTSAAFASTTNATKASEAGIQSVGIFGGSSTTNPYGSYGLGASSYGIQFIGANLATASVNGSAQLATGALSASTTTESGQGTFSAGTTTGLTGTAGSLALDAISYTGSTPQNLQLKFIDTQTWTGTTPSKTGEQFQVLYSTDGGTTWQSGYSNGSSTVVGAAPTGKVTLTGTNVTINFAASTGPVFASAGTTSTTAGTASESALYTVNLTPASATYQLADSSGAPIGSSTTIYGRSTSTQSEAIGNPNSGQALQVNWNAANLFSTTNGSVWSATTGALSSTTTNTSLPSTINVNMTDGTNQTATGSGGIVSSKAVAFGGLSIMSYANATSAQTAIQAALTQISGERAQVGSLMNRLNQASSDLQTSQQNLQSAQGGIMDADIALQMANLSKDQVLQQSGVAMLAQANQVPQALLKLLP